MDALQVTGTIGLGSGNSLPFDRSEEPCPYYNENTMNKQPIQLQERIVLIDCLRGYALMGLFLIHMVEYFELYWDNPVPSRVNTAAFFLFGAKSYGMFALLFGVSFFIIMDRQAQKGVDFRLRFIWRLMVLLAIGFLHSLIYSGDILQILAITGLFLVPLYRFSDRALLITALVFILQMPTLILYWLAQANPNLALVFSSDEIKAAVFEADKHGSLLDVLRVNVWASRLGNWEFMLNSGRISNIMGLSQLGFLIARKEFFTNLDRYRSTYSKVLISALVASAVLMAFAQKIAGLVEDKATHAIVAQVLELYTNDALMMTALFGLIVLYYNVQGVARVMRLFAPCGRMTLTLYVGQAVLCVPIFFGFGLGAYAFIGQAWSLTLGVVLWVLQIWFAHAWFRRYHYGPLEWIWRAATMVRTDIPFKRTGPSPVATA